MTATTYGDTGVIPKGNEMKPGTQLLLAIVTLLALIVSTYVLFWPYLDNYLMSQAVTETTGQITVTHGGYTIAFTDVELNPDEDGGCKPSGNLTLFTGLRMTFKVAFSLKRGPCDKQSISARIRNLLAEKVPELVDENIMKYFIRPITHGLFN